MEDLGCRVEVLGIRVLFATCVPPIPLEAHFLILRLLLRVARAHLRSLKVSQGAIQGFRGLGFREPVGP